MQVSTQPGSREVAALVTALARSVHGTVVTASDTRYEEARELHNAAVGHRPVVVVQVASVADVRATLALADEHGFTTSVRGAGHGIDGSATAGEVVVDLRAFRGITVDARRRTVCVRGGSTVAELDAVAGAYGLVVPGSRFGGVGVVGSALADGTGWLTSRYGPTRASVLAAELVSAERTRTVPLIGGHGVVTSLVLQARPVPPSVVGGVLLYRLADAPEVVAAVHELVERGRPEFAPLLRWQIAPAAAYVPGDVVGRPTLAVFPVWTGDLHEGADFAAPLRRTARPLADGVRSTTYADLQRLLDGTSPWGRRRAQTAVTCRDPGVLAGLDIALADRPTPESFVEVVPTATGWTVRAEAQWSRSSDDDRADYWLTSVTATATASPQPASPQRQGES